MVEWVDMVSRFVSAFPRFLNDKKDHELKNYLEDGAFFEYKDFLVLNETVRNGMSQLSDRSPVDYLMC